MQEIQAIAARLSPSPVRSVTELDKGGNSRIYKVITDGDTYALKRYPKPTAYDPRNRLDIEASALRFMHGGGIHNVPRMVACDAGESYGLLSWCDGQHMTRMEDADIPSFCEFLIRLADLSRNAPSLAYASEACVSGAAILSHIERRLQKLEAPSWQHEGLHNFLNRQLLPALESATAAARKAYAKANLSFDDEIPRAMQILIPSDFGTHNALRGKDGMVFLDFEYFGWDDPVTSTANFVLHPAMAMTEAQKDTFMDHMARYFSNRDPLYAMRLAALMPLFAIRWCAIILGEFIPERWEHRLQSGQFKPQDKEDAQARQLEKATALLDQAA